MIPPVCPICHSSSEHLGDLTDHYFGSPGVWSYRQCTAPRCGVAFPSPAPTDAELATAYSSYYTHEESAGTTLPGAIETALIARSAGSQSVVSRVPFIGWLTEQIAWELGGLKPRQGLIVDIGAGDGARLQRLKRAGWASAIGIEPDHEAVKVAQASSLQVQFGSAEDVPLDSGVADAVIMHHVIEHVRDPHRALDEAYRILKPGGELSIVTPNLNSAGRFRWKEFWRGFEAPRHLTIFTLEALGSLATAVGFDVICNRSSGRSAAWVDEVSSRAAGVRSEALSRVARLRRAERAYRAQSGRATSDHGEEIVFIAHKPSI